MSNDINVLIEDGEIQLKMGKQTITTCGLPIGSSVKWSKSVWRAVLDASAADGEFHKALLEWGSKSTTAADLLAFFDSSDMHERVSRPLIMLELIKAHSPHVAKAAKLATASQIKAAFHALYELENPTLTIAQR
jgi:hypothetical protein